MDEKIIEVCNLYLLKERQYSELCDKWDEIKKNSNSKEEAQAKADKIQLFEQINKIRWTKRGLKKAICILTGKDILYSDREIAYYDYEKRKEVILYQPESI